MSGYSQSLDLYWDTLVWGNAIERSEFILLISITTCVSVEADFTIVHRNVAPTSTFENPMQLHFNCHDHCIIYSRAHSTCTASVQCFFKEYGNTYMSKLNYCQSLEFGIIRVL